MAYVVMAYVVMAYIVMATSTSSAPASALARMDALALADESRNPISHRISPAHPAGRFVYKGHN